jgi:hypothetical protein
MITAGTHPGQEEGPADSFNSAFPAIGCHILETRDVGSEEEG